MSIIKNSIKTIFLLTTIPIITGCDAVIHISYLVENSTNQNVDVFIPNYPLNGFYRHTNQKDTTITLLPNSKVTVGFNSKIDFPWKHKNIYKKSPGICDIIVVKKDTSYTTGCSQKKWIYRKKSSTYKIK